MAIQTFSSREFTRNVAAAKRAAAQGPVFITDRGRPAFALLKIDDYDQLASNAGPSLLALMDAIPGSENIVFDPPRLSIQLQSAELE